MTELQRPTIEDIPEMKIRMRYIRDSEGILQKVNQEFYGLREVNVVKGWARLGHYLLDVVFIYIIRSLFEVALGMAIGAGFIEHPGASLVIWVLVMRYIIIVLYYSIFEIFTSSSPAKLILGRTVVNKYGEKLDSGTALRRSLSRIVPFEIFSCLGERGWHDTWTKTYVVRKEEAEALRRLLAEHELKLTTKDADAYRKATSGPQVS